MALLISSRRLLLPLVLLTGMVGLVLTIMASTPPLLADAEAEAEASGTPVVSEAPESADSAESAEASEPAEGEGASESNEAAAPAVRRETMLGFAGAGSGAPVVSGAAEHLWTIREDQAAERYLLLHAGADAGDEPLVRIFASTLRPLAIAAYDDTVHQIFEKGRVESVTWIPGTQPPQRPYRTFNRRTLPETGSPLDLIALRSGPVVLMKMDTPLPIIPERPAPAPIDEEAATASVEEEADSIADDAAEADAPALDPTVTEDTGPTIGAAPEVATTRLRLMHLRTRENIALPLPPGVSDRDLLRLAMIDGDANRFHLIVGRVLSTVPTDAATEESDQPSDDQIVARSLLVYPYTAVDANDSHFLIGEPESYKLPVTAALQVIGVNRQLILADQPEQDETNLTLYLLRRSRVQSLGTFPLTELLATRWRLASYRDLPAIIVHRPDGSLAWTSWPLTTGETPPTELKPLPIEEPLPFYLEPQSVMFAVTMTFTVLVLFSFWRRSPRTQTIDLPSHMMIAPLIPRGFAALIDFMIPVTLLSFFVTPDSAPTVTGWLNTPQTWEMLLISLAATALTGLHTAISEAFTGTSIGKRIFSLYVATSEGERPTLGQACLRNLCRVFELLITPLMIIPLLNPYRLRLGDMIARTVVFMVKPELEDDEDELD